MAGAKRADRLRQAQQHLLAGRLREAEVACRALLKRNRNDVDAVFLFGMVLSARGIYDEAARHYQRCVRLRPEDQRYRCKLGNAHAALGDYDSALESYDAVLKIDPDNQAALAGKADALERKGGPDEALALLEPIAAAQREDVNVAYIFANLAIKAGRSDEAAEVVLRHLRNPQVQGRPRRRLFFTLGKAYEKLERYGEALEACREGHVILRQPFSRLAHARRIEALMEATSRRRLERLPRSDSTTQLPIFIVGMPRTGSTLCEQIIGAHPQAHPAGELGILPDLVRGLLTELDVSEITAAGTEELTQEMISRTANAYIDHVRRLDREADRIVDKMLYNHEHLWLIELMLPGARVIHMRRNPLDTCLSCYMQTLSPFAHPYLSDVEDLAFVYRQYQRLMQHWSEVLDITRLDVDYEELVTDQERVSRVIIEFCDLPWDDRCLEFYRSADTARTVSYDQVRRPMYSSSVNRAARYGDHLAPLKEALAEDG